MNDEVIICYKKLIPLGPGRWESPLYRTVWENDQHTSPTIPKETNTKGVYARWKPDSELLFYSGCVVTIQAFGQLILAEEGFRCETATVIDYNIEERDAWLAFQGMSTEQKVEVAIR